MWYNIMHLDKYEASLLMVHSLIKSFWYEILQELTPHRKQGAGFLSRMGETMRAVANSVRGLRSRPEEFTLMQEYVEDFSNKISCVDKVAQRIIKEQRGTAALTFYLQILWLI